MASDNFLLPIARTTRPLICKRYEDLADAEANTWFAVRLADCSYSNMDQVIGQALATCRRIEDALPRHRMNGVALAGQV